MVVPLALLRVRRADALEQECLDPRADHLALALPDGPTAESWKNTPPTPKNRGPKLSEVSPFPIENWTLNTLLTHFATTMFFFGGDKSPNRFSVNEVCLQQC